MAKGSGQTVSVADAMRLAEATVKLWDYAGNACQGRFFRLTPQDFLTWKTDNQVAMILGEDIQQDPPGLQRFTSYWGEKVPKMSRCTRRIHEVFEDVANQRHYRVNVRGHWYSHLFSEALPADGADREWVYLINEVNQGWRAAAEFLIKKRNQGWTMI